MARHYFCTLFDSSYLLKGVAMLQSLVKHCPGLHVFVLCMDTTTQDILTKLELSYLTCIPLFEIETESLLIAKKDRGIAEYCWTLSPCLPWYILGKHSDINFITYIDADLLFYSSVEPIFDEIGESSIAIIEHRFTPRLKELEINGRFCVEWVSFRRDDEGMACLSRWREQCIEWCYYQLEENRMGDQKYLDEWPERYTSCHIINHSGAGIAPWNYAQYTFDCINGELTVEDQSLIFYHFHQFKLLINGKFDRLPASYTTECVEPTEIYQIYENKLTQVLIDIRKIYPGFSKGLKSVLTVNFLRAVQKILPTWLKDKIRNFIKS